MGNEIVKHSGMWKKGQSGNPNGRPKKNTSIAEMFNNILDSSSIDIKMRKNNGDVHRVNINFDDASQDEPMTIRQVICTTVTLKALDGDLAAAREIFDRVEGKPAQKVVTKDETVQETYISDEQMLAIKDQLEKNGLNLDDFSY